MATITLENSPFIIRDYKDYDQYTAHQKSKLGVLAGEKSWLPTYEKLYMELLQNILFDVNVANKTCLCLGARTGVEVKAFLDYGCFCIGIDLNPGKGNKYVVNGDASEIQYPDNCVDIVYTNSLDHFLKIEETLSEIKRVLRPFGCFLCVIPTDSDTPYDEYGSVYWKDTGEVIKYITEKYGFIKAKHYILDTNWFSDFIVMVNER